MTINESASSCGYIEMIQNNRIYNYIDIEQINRKRVDLIKILFVYLIKNQHNGYINRSGHIFRVVLDKVCYYGIDADSNYNKINYCISLLNTIAVRNNIKHCFNAVHVAVAINELLIKLTHLSETHFALSLKPFLIESSEYNSTYESVLELREDLIGFCELSVKAIKINDKDIINCLEDIYSTYVTLDCKN